ncbi:MAG: discoidin domain-containing protein [Clostridia bacterium]|nr:discoidin domain-containing protein [Clostridia bacterium]
MKKLISLVIAIVMVVCLGAGLSAFAADAKNVALNDGVSAEVWFDSANGVNPDMDLGFWSVDFLFDGETPLFKGGTPPLGWYATASSADFELFLEITLDKVYEITELKLYPQGFMGGFTFPVAYTVQISEDGTNWTKVGEETDAGGKYLYSTCTEQNVNGNPDDWGEPTVFTYACSSQKAKYVQLLVTKGCNPGDGNFYAGLGEFEVWATEVSETPVTTEGLRDFDKEKGDALSYDAIYKNEETPDTMLGYANEDNKIEGIPGVPNAKQLVDGSDGSIQKVLMHGWFGNKNSEIESYGYQIDDGEPIYGDFVVDKGDNADVQNAGGESRFTVVVDVSGITDGKTHTIRVVAKLKNGEIVKLNRNDKDRDVFVNYKAQLVETPDNPDTPPTGDVSVAVLVVAACAIALVVLKKKVF